MVDEDDVLEVEVEVGVIALQQTTHLSVPTQTQQHYFAN